MIPGSDGSCLISSFLMFGGGGNYPHLVPAEPPFLDPDFLDYIHVFLRRSNYPVIQGVTRMKRSILQME